MKEPVHYHEKELSHRRGTLQGGSTSSIAYSVKARDEGLRFLQTAFSEDR